MGVLRDGQRVHCDGRGCLATALLPVALRSKLSDTSPATKATSAHGWLFAGSQGDVKHFCPRCLPFYLPQALDGVIQPRGEKVLVEETENRYQDDEHCRG